MKHLLRCYTRSGSFINPVSEPRASQHNEGFDHTLLATQDSAAWAADAVLLY